MRGRTFIFIRLLSDVCQSPVAKPRIRWTDVKQSFNLAIHGLAGIERRGSQGDGHPVLRLRITESQRHAEVEVWHEELD